MPTFEVTGIVPGPAPVTVRQAWEGIELPEFPIDGFDRITSAGGLGGDYREGDCFVPAELAVGVLSQKVPPWRGASEAVNWCRYSSNIIQPGMGLAFDRTVTRAVQPDEEWEIRLEHGWLQPAGFICIECTVQPGFEHRCLRSDAGLPCRCEPCAAMAAASPISVSSGC